MAAITGEVTLMEQVVGDLSDGDEGCYAIQGLPGIGPVPLLGTGVQKEVAYVIEVTKLNFPH